MPISTSNMASTSASHLGDNGADPLAGVDHIIVIDNGAHNIRIASIPFPFSDAALAAASSTSSSSLLIDPSVLAHAIAIDVFPNAIARTRAPHTVPTLPSPGPTAPTPGSKTSIFVSSHIHTLLDDYAALHLRLPHQSGIVVDWAAQKTIWDHVLTNHLAKLPGGISKGSKLLAGKAVVMTEAYFDVDPAQYASDLLLFEQYGAQAVWRTSAAALVACGTDVFRSHGPSLGFLGMSGEKDAQQEEEAAMQEAPTVQDTAESGSVASKRPLRPPRAATSTHEPAMPRILTIRRPQSMLVLDLGYSYCHVIPIINAQPVYPSIRRLELGGKMLINLLKETLSFQQLDMMDESWLMSHIFANVSFVAAEVGERPVYGDKVERELEAVQRKEAAEWSYNDLLLLCKFGRGKGKGVGVTWSLPDYGGGRGGSEAERDRARYGFVVGGPNPKPSHAMQTPTRGTSSSQQQRKRSRLDPLLDWESSFIASSSSTTSSSKPTSSKENDNNEEEEEDLQTLHLASERFSILENLFNPLSLNLDQKPLPELILDSITSVSTCNISNAKSAADMMWSNILLTGGLSNAVNLRRRLQNELRPLAPADVPVRIWPDAETRHDASTTAIKAGVVMACEISARQTIRETTYREAAAATGSGSSSGKKKPRKSRGDAAADGAGKRKIPDGRWLTYAQWMNAGGSGGASDAEIVKAANRVFYSLPPVQADTSSDAA